VLAVCLAAGLEGIRCHIEPPVEVPENIYEMAEEERVSRGIEALPANLYEAVMELKQDSFIRGVLGNHVTEKYVEAKKAEWQQYVEQVTAWEIDEYLYKI
jgi:glutamine synthetase